MRVGPYDLLSELGRGAMGVVYRVRSATGEEVALKLLARSDSTAFDRFDRERRLLGSFTARDGFVPLLDAGVAREGAFLVMPLVAGGTLRDRLRRGPLGVEATIALGLSLAHALGRAHEKGIVHRDLKPENILFSKEGAPLVSDLGIAKHFDRSAPGASQSVSFSERGDLVGTAGYMAPEQMSAASSAGPPADVFALGAILYECLDGRPAFTGQSLLDILARVVDGSFEPLSKASGAPRWLRKVVERCLKAEPGRRYRDGLALRRALEAGPRSGRRTAALLAVGAAGLGAVGLVVLRPSRETGGPTPPTTAVVKSATPTRVSSKGATAETLTAQGFFERGVERAAKDDDRGALEDFTAAIERDATLAEAWANRGHAKSRLGQPGGALADFDKAIELAPTLAPAWRSRGHLKVMLGSRDEALADLDRAIELAPRDAVAWQYRGEVKATRGDTEGAILDFDQSLALRPDVAHVHLNRARLRAKKGDRRGALADYTRATELRPDFALAWAGRASIEVIERENENAIASASRALELDPKIAEAWANRGSARANTGDFAGAWDDLSRAVELAPLDGSTWRIRGHIALKRGDRVAGLADLDKAVQLSPNDRAAFHLRGVAKLETGDARGALADFEQALALGGLDPIVLSNRAKAKAKLGDDAGAIADYERVLELAPDSAVAKQVRPELEALRARREK